MAFIETSPDSNDSLNHKNVESIPGIRTVTPWILSRRTDELLAFIKKAFGGRETVRMHDETGRIVHAETVVGDSVIMMFDLHDSWPDSPAFLRLFVEDADAVYNQALKAGATSITEVTHLAFGDRVGRICDPLGNVWWIQSRVEEVSLQQMESRWGEPEFAGAMDYVQSTLARFLSRNTEKKMENDT